MRRPQYVTNLLQDGEFGSYKDDTWYIVKRKSRRVEGSPFPESYLERIAIATPEGRFDIAAMNEIQPVPVGIITCKEFGYSYALNSLKSSAWVKQMGEDSQCIFTELIRKESPTSYLLDNVASPTPKKNRNFNIQIRNFWEHLSPGLNQELQPLKLLHLICLENRYEIEQPTSAQNEILEKYNVNIREYKRYDTSAARMD